MSLRVQNCSNKIRASQGSRCPRRQLQHKRGKSLHFDSDEWGYSDGNIFKSFKLARASVDEKGWEAPSTHCFIFFAFLSSLISVADRCLAAWKAWILDDVRSRGNLCKYEATKSARVCAFVSLCQSLPASVSMGSLCEHVRAGCRCCFGLSSGALWRCISLL